MRGAPLFFMPSTWKQSSAVKIQDYIDIASLDFLSEPEVNAIQLRSSPCTLGERLQV